MGRIACNGNSRWRTVLVIGLLVLGSCTVAAPPGLQPEARQVPIVGGAHLRLTLREETSHLLFSVELHSIGSEPLVLNVGMMLANGKQQYADRIHLLLAGPDNKLLHLEMTGPGVVAGRIDPMVLTLPAGATFSLPVALSQYSAAAEKVWKLDLKPGRYSLQAEYTGVGVPQQAANLDMQGIAVMPFWTGTVRSNVLSISVD